MLEFFQINENKALLAAVELDRLVRDLNEYVCLVTEPYKKKCRIAARPDIELARGQEFQRI